MDVTSLLNKSATSAYCKKPKREITPSSGLLQQESLSSASLPTPSPERTTPQQDWESKSAKNRTPWSAGGYALPLQSEPKFRSNSIFSFRSGSEVLDSDGSVDPLGIGRHSRRGSTDSASIEMESSQTSLPSTRPQNNRSNNWEESRQTGVETPDSLGHKFSDSHSSLSSYASWRSRSHSRISSVTTVSGIHSAGPSLTELPLLETTMASYSESYHTPTSAKRTPQSSGARLPPYHQNGEMDAPRRSGSPSDAVLNMKGSSKPLPMEAPTSDPSSREPRVTSSSKSHKRATSAPDFLQSKNLRQLHTVLPPPREVMAIAEDASPNVVARNNLRDDSSIRTKYNGSDHGGSEPDRQDSVPDVAAPKPIRTLSSSAVSSAAAGYEQHQHAKPSNNVVPLDEDEGEMPVCMFVDECDTGSQLRKAISHLFGRNKTCTLKIPKMVWVYYCRKHYQRVRYRNARTYPVTQMELVETQIERLKSWSDQNKARGKGAYIKSWTLSLRKREEKRLQGNKGGNDDDEDATALGSGHIPSWLIGELGEGYDTARMFAIAARLREEIENGTLTQVPEIEFLPDIVDDDKDKDITKPTRQRRQNSSMSMAKTPKRKAPDFPVMTRPSPTYNDASYGSYTHDGGYDVDGVVSPSGKRPRTARAATFPHHQTPEAHGSHTAGPSRHYMASSYAPGHQGASPLPPRAQNIVPKMQPMEYNHHYPHGAVPGRFDQTHPGQGHARVASYQGIPESGYTHEPYYQHHSIPGYTQAPMHFSGSQSSPNSPPTLPPISAQMHGTISPYRHHDRALPGARPHLRGASRPMHQRSASAYTPGSRYIPMAGRPSSSGNGIAVDAGRYEATGHMQPAASYDAGHHGPQGYGENDLRHHQYDGKSAWAPAYGHPAPPPAPNHSHYHYSHGPNYGPASQAVVSSHNGASAGANNAMSVYPEPKGTPGTRSA